MVSTKPQKVKLFAGSTATQTGHQAAPRNGEEVAAFSGPSGAACKDHSCKLSDEKRERERGGCAFFRGPGKMDVLFFLVVVL